MQVQKPARLRNREPGLWSDVKFVFALVTYLLMGFVLGYGILLTVHGKPWLLIAAFLAYALLFAKIGCLPRKSH